MALSVPFPLHKQEMGLGHGFLPCQHAVSEHLALASHYPCSTSPGAWLPATVQGWCEEILRLQSNQHGRAILGSPEDAERWSLLHPQESRFSRHCI